MKGDENLGNAESALMEPNSRAGNMASGTNATNYNDIKELIRLVKCVQKKGGSERRKPQFCFYQQLLFYIFCIKLTLLNHSAKVKWDVSFLIYFHISHHRLSDWIIYTVFPKTGRHLRSSADFLCVILVT